MALLVLEMNVRSGAKSHWKPFKSGPGRVQNHQKSDVEAFLGGLEAFGFMNAERRADKDQNWSHFGAAWLILCAILAPSGFRRADPLGVYRCIWRNRKVYKNQVFFSNCMAKDGECKPTKNMNRTTVQSTRRFSKF